MQYYTLEEVVSEAMSIVRDRDKYEAVSRQWVYNALMQFGVSEDEIEVEEITVKNLLAPKPANCRSIIEVACYDAQGNFIPSTMRAGKKRIYPNSEVIATTIVNDSQVEAIYYSADLSEDRHNIILGTNAIDVAKVKIRYYSYPLDADGQPMIREDEKMGCVYFIRFMIALEKDDNQSKIAADELRWKLECDRIMAGKKASSMNNERLKGISRNWMRLIPSFNMNKF